MGVECYEKVKIIDDKKFQIKIWDTAGQEKFAVMAKSYYQRAHGIILTCAVNNTNSFYNLKNWLNSLKDNTNEEKIQIIIIANKCDLVDEREVSTEEIAKKAKEINAEYFETSAKDNTNIENAFNSIIDKVVRNVYSKTRTFSLTSPNNSGKNKRCCLNN
jgi:small GTP-binding protein